MPPDAAELMHSRMSANHCPIANRDVPGKGDAVRENAVVAKMNVVGNVAISKQRVIVANDRLKASAFSATVDRNKLANAVAVADSCVGSLAVVFQILRSNTDRGIGEEDIVFANHGGAFDVDVRHQSGARTNLHIRANDTERPDVSAGINAGLGIYDSRWMNRH